MKRKDLWIKILAETCRLLLGLVFLFSGASKAVDPVGGTIKISEYLSSFGLDSLQSFSLPFAINLAAVELPWARVCFWAFIVDMPLSLLF